MVVVVGNPQDKPPGFVPEYSCTICGDKFIPKRKYHDKAKTFLCGKQACQATVDAERMRRKRDLAKSIAKEDRVDQTKGEPHAVVARFRAKIGGGRFTSVGGASVSLIADRIEKYDLLPVIDRQGWLVEVIIRNPHDDKDVDPYTLEPYDGWPSDDEDEDGDPT